MNRLGDTSELLRTLSEVNFLQVGLVVIGAWRLIALSSRSLSWAVNRVSGPLRGPLSPL